jgi:serralysin
MLLDVLALQYLYGPNWNANTGNDVYDASEEEYYATIWDAGGIDLLDYSNVQEGWRVVLPNQQLTPLVPTFAGSTFPVSQAAPDQSGVMAPTNFFWLTGELENVLGSPFADEIFGNQLANWLRGAGGNDVLIGSGANDIMSGGGGVDTVVYSGSQGSYTLSLSTDQTTLHDRRPDGNDFDELIDLEIITFDQNIFEDGFDLRQFGGPTNLTSTQLESFIELYIAYFNRAPDAVGLNFWGTAFASGTTLDEMAALFVGQPETRAAYPDGTSDQAFATSVYNNVLGRTPDQAGIDFWVGLLNSGGVGRDEFILRVLQGAKSDLKPEEGQAFVDQQLEDRAFLESKIDIGAYFAVHKGMSDVQNASATMAIFNGSQASLDSAFAAIDVYYQDALDPFTGEFLMPLVGVLDAPGNLA